MLRSSEVEEDSSPATARDAAVSAIVVSSCGIEMAFRGRTA